MSRIVGKYAIHGSQESWLENLSPSIIKSAVNRNICSIFINCSKIFAKDLTNSVILQNNSNQYLIRLTTSLVRYLIQLDFFFLTEPIDSGRMGERVTEAHS